MSKFKPWQILYLALLTAFVGLGIGITVERAIATKATGISHFDLQDKITACEADLPRNLKCKVEVVKP